MVLKNQTKQGQWYQHVLVCAFVHMGNIKDFRNLIMYLLLFVCMHCLDKCCSDLCWWIDVWRGSVSLQWTVLLLGFPLPLALLQSLEADPQFTSFLSLNFRLLLLASAPSRQSQIKWASSVSYFSGHNVATKTFFMSNFRPLKPPPTNHITATFFSKLLIGPNWPIVNFDTFLIIHGVGYSAHDLVCRHGCVNMQAVSFYAGERLRRCQVFVPQKRIWRDSCNPAA